MSSYEFLYEIQEDIKTTSLLLGMEALPTGKFNFSSTGLHDSFYRNKPALVSLNEKKFTLSYDSIIYTYAPNDILAKLHSDSLHVQLWSEMDTLFERETGNTVRVSSSKKYRRIVNKELRKAKSPISFDGCFSYTLYKVKFDYIEAGFKEIYIPNAFFEEGCGLFYKKKCRVRYIINIHSVESP